MNWIDPWGLSASEKKNELTRDQTLDTIQMTLNMAGLIPGVGEVADVANSVISLARGNYIDAAFSDNASEAAAHIPLENFDMSKMPKF